MFKKALLIGFLLMIVVGQLFEIVTTLFIVRGTVLAIYVIEIVVMLIFCVLAAIYLKRRFRSQAANYSLPQNRSAWFD
mgnify:CR=1 FL=1